MADSNDPKDVKDPTVETKRQLIILKAKPTSLKSAESFLRNRSWDLLTTTEVKKSLPAILAGKASYILLTVEHANANVMKLPQVINQNLKIPIIYFAEGLSPHGPALLNKLAYPYVIYPPVSGPAIERMILKYERDEKNRLESLDANLKSEQQFSDSTPVDQTYRINAAREEMAKVFGGEGGSDMDFFSHQKGTAGSFDTNQAGSGNLAHSTKEAGFTNQNLHSAREAALGNGIQGNGAYGNPQQGKTPHIGIPQTQNAKSSGANGLSSAHSVRNNGSEETANVGADVRAFLNSDGEKSAPNFADNDKSVLAKKTNAKSSGKNIIVGLDKPKPKKEAEVTPQPAPQAARGNFTISSDSKSVVLPGQGTVKSDSIMIQGAQHALETVVRDPTEASHALGISTDLHCFFVETAKFRGYVLVAYASNKDLAKQFKDDLRKTFMKFIRASGIAIEIRDWADVTILEVDFEEWSLKESEFLVKSVHEGAEVAVTFFPTDETHRSVEISPDGKMLSVPLEDIDVGVPLDFDLFLYMPTNNKYFHYTKRNGQISQSQKDRLLKSKMNNLHVMPDARDNVSKYRTTKFLNSKIKAHKKSKAS